MMRWTLESKIIREKERERDFLEKKKENCISFAKNNLYTIHNISIYPNYDSLKTKKN